MNNKSIKKHKVCFLLSLLYFSYVTSTNLLFAQTKEDNARLNYAWSAETARESAENQVFIDIHAYMIGVEDAYTGYHSLMSDEQTEAYFVEQMQRVKSYRRAKADQDQLAIEENDKKIITLVKSKKYLITSPSGLAFEILKPGRGQKPSFQDHVKIDYRVRDLSQNIIYESKNRFIDKSVALYLLNAGMVESLQNMKAGEQRRLYLPSRLSLQPGSLRTQLPPLYESPQGAAIIDLTLVEIVQHQ